MQVARNFFLSRKKTYTRKLKEILLAIKIDHELSKQKILNLYLNEIYFGNRAYGVGAAAQIYYGKNIDQLNLAQLAMLAGLPKAPSSINPLANPEAALKRRNHVLGRIFEMKYISEEEYNNAINTPLSATYHSLKITCPAPYVAEMVRSAIVKQFGTDAYNYGLNVYTTISCPLQKAAQTALRDAVINYDHRHGWRGAQTNLGHPLHSDMSKWQDKLKNTEKVHEMQPAAILDVNSGSAKAILEDGSEIYIPWAKMSWAKNSHAKIASPSDVVMPGDLIYVQKSKNSWHLAQIPEVEGAITSIDPQDGAIVAMVGGFDQSGHFNRVVQAKRQPGSSFKPFIYAAALAKNFTLANIINDAPIVVEDPNQPHNWRPQNSTKRFYGPTRLRIALTRSRNLVSIRLLQAIGINYTIDYLQKFNFDPKNMPRALSLALGTGDVTPLELAAGYAVFANGGFQVNPYIIDHIDNAKQETIFRAAAKKASSTDNNAAPQTITPQIAYLITSALQDAIQTGTGRGAKVLKRDDLAGKTGSTNDLKDGWFAGYNSDYVTVTWMGFDHPRSLYEYGSKAALPMWIDYMRTALKGKTSHSMPRPKDLITVRIDSKTGKVALAGQTNTVFEIFRSGNAPKITDAMVNNYNAPDSNGNEIIELF
jgi:penicillin-binding protein 1A